MIHNDFAAGFRAKKNEIKRLNKRIAELEADVRKSNIIHTAQNGAIDRLNARIAELEKDNDELEKRCDKEFKDGFWRGFEVRAMNPVDSCIQGHYDWQVHLREQGE